MILPNHKDIYKQVSEKYNIDLNLVEKVGSFTWNDLNDRISNFKNREIYMYKLGVWKFRKVKGESYLNNLRKEILMIRNAKKLSEEEKDKLINKVVEKINKISVLINEWNNIIEERKQFKDEHNIRNI